MRAATFQQGEAQELMKRIKDHRSVPQEAGTDPSG
jgi:hypothetical protein